MAISAAIQQSILSLSLHKRLSSHISPELLDQIIQQPATVIKNLPYDIQLQARLSYLESIEGVFGWVVFGGVVLSGICLAVRARPLD